MNDIYVFTDNKSINERIFTGRSNSGKTGSISVTKLEVKSRDELISNAMLLAPENSTILVAYGPLTTSMQVKEIYDAIEFLVDNIDYEIFYLTNYSDNCKLRSDDHSYNQMLFQRSVSPHGTECILISPKGVNKILDLIKGDDGRGYDFYLNSSAEKMLLYVSSPPMMFVDLNKRQTDLQLIKGSICREMISAEKPLELTKKYTGNMNLFWFFLIVVFILFIAAMIISFGGDDDIPTNSQVTTMTAGKQNIGRSMSQWN